MDNVLPFKLRFLTPLTTTSEQRNQLVDGFDRRIGDWTYRPSEIWLEQTRASGMFIVTAIFATSSDGGFTISADETSCALGQYRSWADTLTAGMIAAEHFSARLVDYTGIAEAENGRDGEA